MSRCVDCGFLAIRHHDSGRLVEVTPAMRVTWLLSDQLGGPNPTHTYDDRPICFAMVAELCDEAAADGSRPLPRMALAVINKPRTCEAFMRYRRGYTPKEHDQMLSKIGVRKLEEERLG